MEEREIDVRFEADVDAPTMDGNRPMLTWGRHPIHGNGWTLWYYLPDEDAVDDYFIGGDVTDVDYAVASARKHLLLYGPSGPLTA